MRSVLYLAWRYLSHHRGKTAILLGAVALILYVPAGLKVLVDQSGAALTARAVGTPLVMGAKGSPLELVLSTLYFEPDSPLLLRYGELERLEQTGLARVIPIEARFRAGDFPIVGTTLDYFEFRDLRLTAGRWMGMLGECVLGSEMARQAGVGPGGRVVSSPQTVFNLAGVYPLRMRVAGVLAPAGTADDQAVFVDVKTAWVIAGLGHGHEDLNREEAADGVLRREAGLVVANASVVEYNEITPENAADFHFHGDTAAFPVTGLIVLPKDERAGTLLLGRYLGEEERVQLVRPKEVMTALLGTVLTVRNQVMAAMMLLGASTLATGALVFWLSVKLRRREMNTMHKIGGARGRMAAVLAAEIVLVLLGAVAVATVLTWVTRGLGPAGERWLLGL